MDASKPTGDKSIQIVIQKTLFLDWDDTLFPSTALRNLINIFRAYKSARIKFDKNPDSKITQKLQQSVVSALELIRNKWMDDALIFIVTNASRSWIDSLWNGNYSSVIGNILSPLKSEIQKRGIRVISAKDKWYKDKGYDIPFDQIRAKYRIFMRVLRVVYCIPKADKQVFKQCYNGKYIIPLIYSIGDGAPEFISIEMAVKKIFGKTLKHEFMLKKWKMLDAPSIELIEQQLKLIDATYGNDTQENIMKLIKKGERYLDNYTMFE